MTRWSSGPASRPMIVAGVMSGTSADGIDVALLRLRGRGLRTRIEFLAHHHRAYPARVRSRILELMNAPRASVAELARLNFLLGELYAQAISSAARAAAVKPHLVGCHGQTLYHQARPREFLGARIATTWQTGEAAIIARRLGLPVVSDFRPADLAAGGQGAPLVPLFDYLYFRHPRRGRILQNLGGIANLTAIPAAARPGQVVAFDTGPGNMVMDALAQRWFKTPCDFGGRIATRGHARPDVLQKILRQPFFLTPPPRSAGREQFGREFVADFISYFNNRRLTAENKLDAMATATALTAESIAQALRLFVCNRRPKNSQRKTRSYQELILSGGGAANRTLLRMLTAAVRPLALEVRLSSDFGIPSPAKEAAAFALLAYHTWRRLPGNLPAATGARRPVVLGKLSLP